MKPPKVIEHEGRFLNAEEARGLLDASLGPNCTSRRSWPWPAGRDDPETLGVIEGDVNYATGRLTIRRAMVMGTKGTTRIKRPKTQMSARTLVIPAFALAVLRPLDPATPLCLRVNGEPWKPHDLSREFARVIQRKKLPRVTYHRLRHSFATISLQSGTVLKHTSAARGHSGVAITGRIYAHVLDAVQEEAAVRLDNLLGRAPVNECDPNATQGASGE